MSRRWRAGALAAALLVTLAACGDDDEASPGTTVSSSTPTSTGAPTADDVTTTTTAISEEDLYTVEAANGTVTLDGRPERIVVLSPTHTETLFAIGAGSQVIAVDSLSNYPLEAAGVVTDLSAFEPSVEAITEYEPDLVVVGQDDAADLTAQFAGLGIPVWNGPAVVTFDEVYAQVEQLGVLTGNVAGAAEVVANMQSDLAAIEAGLPELDEPLTFFHELENTLYSVTSETFIGHAYTVVGLRNIADAAEAASAYPQLSPEFVISEDPDLIFLADATYGESAETVAARPGWEDLTAVRNGNVIAVDADIASRWGPRVVEYLEVVAAAVESAAAVPAG